MNHHLFIFLIAEHKSAIKLTAVFWQRSSQCRLMEQLQQLSVICYEL